MIGSIGYNLRHLLDFRGREGRKAFLTFFAFVFVLNIVIYGAAFIPAMSDALSAGMAAAQSGNTSGAEMAVMEQMIGFASTLVQVSLMLAVLNIALLSAAFVRRAHDSGLPGLVLIIPLGLQLVWMFFTYRQMGGIEQTLRSAIDAQALGIAPQFQAGMIAQDLIGWLTVGIVVVIGSMRSQQAKNQYGDYASPK